MPRRKIDEAYVNELICEAKETFYKSPLFNKKTKDLLRSIEPCILISKDMSDNFYATAGIEHSRSYEVNEFNLKDKMPYVMIEGRMSWYVLEFNKMLLSKVSRQSVYDTVSHELAHLLEMRLNGIYDRHIRKYHNALWKKIHRAMGGCGMATEEGYIKWLLKNKSAK